LSLDFILFSLLAQLALVCFVVHLFAVIGKHQLESRDEIRQVVETVWTNYHVVESHAYRVGGESFLVEDRDFGVSLTEVCQQSKFGPHRTANFDRLVKELKMIYVYMKKRQ
jgi:hypothetical protein